MSAGQLPANLSNCNEEPCGQQFSQHCRSLPMQAGGESSLDSKQAAGSKCDLPEGAKKPYSYVYSPQGRIAIIRRLANHLSVTQLALVERQPKLSIFTCSLHLRTPYQAGMHRTLHKHMRCIDTQHWPQVEFCSAKATYAEARIAKQSGLSESCCPMPCQPLEVSQALQGR